MDPTHTTSFTEQPQQLGTIYLLVGALLLPLSKNNVSYLPTFCLLNWLYFSTGWKIAKHYWQYDTLLSAYYTIHSFYNE